MMLMVVILLHENHKQTDGISALVPVSSNQDYRVAESVETCCSWAFTVPIGTVKAQKLSVFYTYELMFRNVLIMKLKMVKLLVYR